MSQLRSFRHHYPRQCDHVAKKCDNRHEGNKFEYREDAGSCGNDGTKYGEPFIKIRDSYLSKSLKAIIGHEHWAKDNVEVN